MDSKRTTLRHALAATTIVLLLLETGCIWQRLDRGPDLADVYERAAQAQHIERNPIIVIPGIMGSNLHDAESDAVVWGAFTGKYVGPKKPVGARLAALPMREGAYGAVVDADDRSRRYEDLHDPDLWERLGWGLASPKQDEVLKWLLPDVTDPDRRRRVARDHLRKSLARARQFAEAMDAPAERPPRPTSLYLVAGDAIPTPAVLAVDPESGALEVVEHQPGDRTVLRSSALMDERLSGEWSPGLVSPIPWSHAIFLFRGHLRLTKDPVFTDNVLFILLEQQDHD